MTRPRRLVVQSYAPTRRAVSLAVLGLLLIAALYIAFETGRRRAGYDIISARAQQGELRDELQRVNRSVVALRAESAELATLKASQSRERAEVSRTIGELQAQVARQSQELTFYKGLVVQGAGAPAGGPEVKIQQFRIAKSAAPLGYVVKLTLAQPSAPKNQVSGTLLLSVAGQGAGRADTLDLAHLTAGRLQEQPFTLRYFENLQIDITLPAGFRPERLQLELRSSRKGVPPLVQSFLWSVEAN